MYIIHAMIGTGDRFESAKQIQSKYVYKFT
nr:MAG TPA: hypothetical protein [Caudoviricetes sp.]